nr:FTR1 family protein [uncultured Desulfobulbus sp.]
MYKRMLLLMMILCLWGGCAFAAAKATENYGPVVAQIKERGGAAIAAYAPANGVLTGNEFSRIYFDIFETSGMEFTLGLKDNAFMLKIESSFSLIISQSMRGEPKGAIESTWATLQKDLDYAVEQYARADGEQGFWGRALQSFTILFREGVEAMLVVAALVAYLRRSGFGDKVGVIWQGVGWALGASVGAAWLLNTLIKTSGAQQEAIEGVTMLIAAGVLIYVSYWLTAKRDADRWQAFIKEKMDRALSRGNLFALGFVAFLAVFREGAETILFYQALMAGTSGEFNAIAAGMGLALVGLVAVYLLVRLASVRLPLGLFFGGTAILLYMMALVFSGQGILELQVAGMLHTTKLEGWPMISWLGVFPTLESMICQAVVVSLLPLGWMLLKFRQGEKGGEAEGNPAHLAARRDASAQ